MIKRILKIIGALLGVLVILIIIGGVAAFFISQSRINQTYAIEVAAVDVPDTSDEAAIERGEHLYQAIGGCAMCHSVNLGGDGALIDEFLLGRLGAPNLTTGEGGIGADLTDLDITRAVRHGVDREGKGIVAMWSQGFYYYSDQDLGALIAYIRNAEPVDNAVPDDMTYGPLLRVFTVLLADDIFAARVIDHDAPRPAAPEPGVTVEYGEYLARVCAACHSADLSGGFGPNLTREGNLGEWTQEQFANTLRSGRTPDGRDLNPDEMPWQYFGGMTDDELEALWMYLQSLPAA